MDSIWEHLCPDESEGLPQVQEMTSAPQSAVHKAVKCKKWPLVLAGEIGDKNIKHQLHPNLRIDFSFIAEYNSEGVKTVDRKATLEACPILFKETQAIWAEHLLRLNPYTMLTEHMEVKRLLNVDTGKSNFSKGQCQRKQQVFFMNAFKCNNHAI